MDSVSPSTVTSVSPKPPSASWSSVTSGPPLTTGCPSSRPCHSSRAGFLTKFSQSPPCHRRYLGVRRCAALCHDRIDDQFQLPFRQPPVSVPHALGVRTPQAAPSRPAFRAGGDRP